MKKVVTRVLTSVVVINIITTTKGGERRQGMHAAFLPLQLKEDKRRYKSVKSEMRV